MSTFFPAPPRWRPLVVLVAALALSAIGHFALDVTTAAHQGREVDALLSGWIHDPKAQSMAASASLDVPGGRLDVFHQTFGQSVVQVQVVEADIQCGEVRMAAINADGNILKWHSDPRYLATEGTGHHRIVMSVFSAQNGGRPFRILLGYDPACVSITRRQKIPVQVGDRRHGLVNDVFRFDGTYWVPRLSGGNPAVTAAVDVSWIEKMSKLCGVDSCGGGP